jgi:hypothetical protein
MDTENQPPDLTLQLPRDVYHLAFTLRGMLPPPETDTPEAEARRDRGAIALVASVLPANGEEAYLAARSVGLAIYAMDCLRQAGDYRGDPSFFLKCNAQAASTERKAQSARTLLLRLQAERRKREADNASADKAAWSEHCAIGLMADVLAHPLPRPLRRLPRNPCPTRSPRRISMRSSTHSAPCSSVPRAACRSRAISVHPPELATPSSPAPTQPSEPGLSHPQGHETSMRFQPPSHVRAQNNVLACRDGLPNPARRGALKPHA